MNIPPPSAGECSFSSMPHTRFFEYGICEVSPDRRHQLSDEDGGDDSALSDADDAAEKEEREQRGERHEGTVEDDFDLMKLSVWAFFDDGLNQPLGGHGHNVLIQEQNKPDDDQENADAEHPQPAEIGGKLKIAEDELGEIHEISKDRGKDQLSEADPLERAP